MGYAHNQGCKRKSSSITVGYGKKMKSETVTSTELFVPVAPRAKEEDEVWKGLSRKKKKTEKSAEELGLVIERTMAELELAAELDAELNMENKPALNKVYKLPLLTSALSKQQLQFEFLDRGVLTLLKNWLEPLPDGSLPNINVRTGVLKVLTQLHVDLEDYGRREQLKTSGLGRVIMFLSRSDEETTSNRKLAKDLVDKWSRPIFNKSTRFEDSRKDIEDGRVIYRRPVVKNQIDRAVMLNDLDEFIRQRSCSEPWSSQHASKPEASPLNFVVRPQSKIDPYEIRARAKLVVPDKCRLKINKKLQHMKASKKKMLQASKLSAEGRGMVKLI
ncbi:hypothetical protein MKW94_018364 [Papaver nudicaule]|uniref:TFIIS N-terminal domain-containing protein n=1 Tax=Papaver nudicaule TaxID=74823 RepID=A0AA41W1Y4_PAPNU|nr:hypothetical protein [Papaver nudicaule]